MTAPTSFVFENHFHPYVGKLVEALTHRSVRGMLAPSLQALKEQYFVAAYDPNRPDRPGGHDASFAVEGRPKEFDTSPYGPYSLYNWELFFHTPVSIAAHLSKTGRYAEAQRWFHFVFDPTSSGIDDPSVDPNSTPPPPRVPAPDRYWRFRSFRTPGPDDIPRIDELVALLGQDPDGLSPEQKRRREKAATALEQVREHPFEPHRVAAVHQVAYQYWVVMAYVRNLTDWADSLFRQDTAEAITEATALYVLAGDILGPRPQPVPQRHRRQARSYRQLKTAADKGELGPLGNAVVAVENLLPFAGVPGLPGPGTDASAPLLGITRTSYFCVPANERLLASWDLVADRLFKIRHCQDISGTVRQLALFEPALDPGVLSAAIAAGVDVAGATGARRPAVPVRSTLWLQKALELAGDVRSHGSALLAALEKRDGEELARLRQGHEVRTAQRTREIRFLGWKESEENTEALIRSRAAIFARYRHHQLLLGRPESEVDPQKDVTLARVALGENDFDGAYEQLVTRYTAAVTQDGRPAPALAQESDPQVRSGGRSRGQLNLLPTEYAELNVHLPSAQANQEAATAVDVIFGVLGMLPTVGVDLLPFGAGGHAEYGGPLLSSVGHTLASVLRGQAEQDNYHAGRAAKIAGYQRRDLDFVQQSNQAALELAANGRQLIAGLIREQVARHEYEQARGQAEQAGQVDEFLASKDTGTELYTWLVAEVQRTFAETYRTAVDVGRAAEQAMKRELMRPELDAARFVSYDWDGSRRGLQAGERLHLDLKRMELAYHEHNGRELEMTKSVSLQQLDPLALLTLRATGSCTFSVPEWLYDLDARGHHLRRIRSVALSLPAVTGPYTTVAATLSLLGSSIRTSPVAGSGDYGRRDGEDSRFVDYAGAIESVVTSTAVNDPGTFEPRPGDERRGPFELAGAISRWSLSLPSTLRTFDYRTISDAVLHIRYTARPGVAPGAVTADIEARLAGTEPVRLARAFSLRHDMPSAWATFLAGTEPLQVEVRRNWFPYFVQDSTITLRSLELHVISGGELDPDGRPAAPTADPGELTTALADGGFTLSLPADEVLRRADDTDAYLVVRYTIA